MADRRRRLLVLLLALAALNGLALAGLAGLGAVGGAACVGLGAVAWLLGLRHAFDADHIAAIDNVTRRLRQQGHRPVAVGFFFSMGHSTVVLLMTLALALGLSRAQGVGAWLSAWGVPVSLLASAAFLTAIGALNLRALRRLREGAHSHPRFGPVAGSHSMFPLGLVFGLNLDTAGEILMLCASAAALGAGALPLWAMMAFPLLLTAGMSAADSAEGLMMMRLYDWAVADADRTLRLNSATTALSVVLAFAVGIGQWIAFARWCGIALGGGHWTEALGGATAGAAATLVMGALWMLARTRRTAAVAVPTNPV